MNKDEILNDAFNRIRFYFESNNYQGTPVVKFKTPSELANVINFPVSNEGLSQSEFIELYSRYLEYSVRTGNKQFLNQLYSGINFPSFLGDMFTSLTNTSMYTYEVAPVATVIEKEMIKLMNSYVGYTDGDGIFVTGGSNGNLLAMLSARNKKLPQIRNVGYDHSIQLKAFVSEHAHYSFETAANIIGIGSNNVVKIKTDVNGKIIPAELEIALSDSIARNEAPFFVGATCATTLLGAYDPIYEMAEICRKYNVWLHADGASGGSIILSEKYRHLLKGIELTDSFLWNPHKLMNIPFVCSAFLVKTKGTLQNNITEINTDYLFHDAAAEDLGKKSIQCGRHVDAVKLWFAWKYYGKNEYQKRIENIIDIAKCAEKIIEEHPQLELLAPRQSFSLCFRYIPSGEPDLNAFNYTLREMLRKSGKTIVNYGFIGKTLALRLAITNGEIKKSDMDLFFKNIFDTATDLMKNKLKQSK